MKFLRFSGHRNLHQLLLLLGFSALTSIKPVEAVAYILNIRPPTNPKSIPWYSRKHLGAPPKGRGGLYPYTENAHECLALTRKPPTFDAVVVWNRRFGTYQKTFDEVHPEPVSPIPIVHGDYYYVEAVAYYKLPYCYSTVAARMGLKDLPVFIVVLDPSLEFGIQMVNLKGVGDIGLDRTRGMKPIKISELTGENGILKGSTAEDLYGTVWTREDAIFIQIDRSVDYLYTGDLEYELDESNIKLVLREIGEREISPPVGVDQTQAAKKTEDFLLKSAIDQKRALYLDLGDERMAESDVDFPRRVDLVTLNQDVAPVLKDTLPPLQDFSDDTGVGVTIDIRRDPTINWDEDQERDGGEEEEEEEEEESRFKLEREDSYAEAEQADEQADEQYKVLRESSYGPFMEVEQDDSSLQNEEQEIIYHKGNAEDSQLDLKTAVLAELIVEENQDEESHSDSVDSETGLTRRERKEFDDYLVREGLLPEYHGSWANESPVQQPQSPRMITESELIKRPFQSADAIELEQLINPTVEFNPRLFDKMSP